MFEMHLEIMEHFGD